jgi:chromosome segregation ATPase
MTQGIRVTLGVLALCLIILLLVVSKQMVNSRTLRQEVGTVRHTLTTSQQQLEAAQALVQRLQQQVEHTRAQIAHTKAQRQQAQEQVVRTETQLQQAQDMVTSLQQEHDQLLQSNQTLQQRVQQQMQEHAAVQTQRDQWQATAREHEEQAQAVHEELRTTRLAFQEQQAVCAPWAEELVGLRQLVSKQHAQLALFIDTDQQVREVVRLQAEHQQAVQQHATLQQQTTQLTAERTALLEEQAQLRQQLQELQTVADVLAQVRTAQQASLAS